MTLNPLARYFAVVVEAATPVVMAEFVTLAKVMEVIKVMLVELGNAMPVFVPAEEVDEVKDVQKVTG